MFPELSLTGYELEAPAIEPADPALRPIAEACAATGSLAFVGAPIERDGQRYIATLVIDGSGVGVAYEKSHLGGDERRSHTPGAGPIAVTVDGWNVGMGICKDTGVAAHTKGTSALGVDVYVAGVVHAPEELDEQDARGLRIAAACDAYVAFASAAGPTGGGYDARHVHDLVARRRDPGSRDAGAGRPCPRCAATQVAREGPLLLSMPRGCALRVETP